MIAFFLRPALSRCLSVAIVYHCRKAYLAWEAHSLACVLILAEMLGHRKLSLLSLFLKAWGRGKHDILDLFFVDTHVSPVLNSLPVIQCPCVLLVSLIITTETEKQWPLFLGLIIFSKRG